MKFNPRTLSTVIVALLLDPEPGDLPQQLLESLTDLTRGPQARGPWDTSLLQAQLFRGDNLEGYLEESIAADLISPIFTCCQLLDAPAGFPNDVAGVHPYPLLNWLHDEISALGKGEILRRDLEPVFDAIREQFIEGKRVFKADRDPTRGKRGEELCGEVLTSLKPLFVYAEDGDTRALAEGMESFLIACEKLETFFLETGAEALGSGPSGLAGFDWFIHALLAYDDELVTRELVVRAQDFTLGRLVEARAKFELAVCLRHDPDSGFYQLAEEVRLGLRESQRWLHHILEHLDDPEVRESAYEQLVNTGELVFELCRTLESTPEGEPEELLYFVRELMTMGQNVVEGGAAPADMEPWLQRATLRLQRADELLPGLPSRVLWYERLVDGVEFYRLGLERVRSFLDDGNPRHLERAIPCFMEAATYLQKVRANLA